MIALLLAACSPSEVVRYDGEAVVRVAVADEAELAAVLDLVPDVWSHSITDHVDVRVDRRTLQALDELGLPSTVLIADVQDAIDASRAYTTPGVGFFDDWQDLQAFYDHLDDLAAQSPWAEVVELGTSLEGNPIRGLRIGTTTGPSDRPGILINGVQHAREWVAGSSAMYVAEQLALGYGTDPDATAILDAYRVLVVPITNPDGYRHTWTTDRLWRKNRRDNLDGTWGVDLNRNWDAVWGGPGSSVFTYSDNYRGTAPFSEPETAAIAGFLESHPQYSRHLDVHCTGQLVLYPWGFSATPSPMEPVLAQGGLDITAAMNGVHGLLYDPGQVYTRLYPASGIAIDWTHARQGMISYLFELRDRGQYGFLLPVDQLIPTAEETWAGVIELAGIPDRPRLWLEDVGPVVPGGTLEVDAWRADPGAVIELGLSTVGLGTTVVPGGPTLEIDLASPAGRAVAGPRGRGHISAPVPAGVVPGDLLTLQAFSGSTLSTVLELEVQ